jgi:hypothetical protein
MRDRVLIRHFLWRFLEHDFVSPNIDRRGVLSAVGGALIGVSLFLSILIATPYQFFNRMPPGLVSIQSLDDRYVFISASMLVMALVAVAQWDALALDVRDTQVLGPLPIPKGAIVRSKVAATTLLAVAVVVGWNLPTMLLRAAAVPIGLPIGWRGLLRLTLAQGASTVGAGAFGFLAVLGVRELVFASLGPSRFGRVSAAVQAVLVVVLTTTLLLIPASARGVARRLGQGAPSYQAMPAVWFVGLHETLAGSVVDKLPRTQPEPMLRAAERDATELYRSRWPVYRELAHVAIAASLLILVTTILAFVWNHRRLPMTVSRPLAQDGTLRRAWTWGVRHIVARTPLRQAGFFFTYQTLSRSVTHRVVMAISLAIGLSFVLVVVSAGVSAGSNVRSIPLALLATQPLLISTVVIGFRHATRMPAERRASRTFHLALTGQAAPYRSGVKRAGWLMVVGPTLLALTVWDTAILGPRVALLHLGIGLFLSALLIETVFVRDRRVPLASGYVPSGDMKVTGLAYLMSVVLGAFALAWVQRHALETVTGYGALLATLGGLCVAVRELDRTSQDVAALLEFDQEAPPPTQRLNLAEPG